MDSFISMNVTDQEDYVKNYSCADHLKDAFFYRRKNLETAIERLTEVDFDSIVCTGISGIMFSSSLSLLMGKHILVIRKGGKTHSEFSIEGSIHPEKVKKWIFVDDLIDTGKTFKRVRKKMNTYVNEESYVGTYLYDKGGNFILREV